MATRGARAAAARDASGGVSQKYDPDEYAHLARAVMPMNLCFRGKADIP